LLEILKGFLRGIQETNAFADLDRYTDKSAVVLKAAGELAAKHSNAKTWPTHLAVSLLDSSLNRQDVQEKSATSLFGRVVERTGGDIECLKRCLTSMINQIPTGSPSPELHLSQPLQTVLSDAIDLARAQGQRQVTLYHLIQAVARDSQIKNALEHSNVPSIELLDAAALQFRGAMNVDKTAAARDTQYLKQHTIDMTALAREGKIDPVIGRDEETDRVIRILSKRTKNNPVILGEPGVGKTTVVEGLARRIVDGDIPDIWSSCKLLSLDVGSVIAGTKHHGDLEDRLTGILKEIEESPERIIFFVDEIHLLMKSPGGGINIANLLKPMLARGQLHCIGATTLGEYAEYIEKDPAFERRFDQVLVEEPTVSETITILRGLKEKYECHHGLHILDAAIVTAGTLAARYLTTRKLPASAIDLIDEAAATARVANDSEPEALRSREREYRHLQIEIQGLKRETDEASKTRLQAAEQEAADAQEELQTMRQKYKNDKQRHKDPTIGVGPDQIKEVVAQQTGIPVTRLNTAEKDRLLHMAEYLKKTVVGQEEAVESVSNAIRLQRSGLRNPNSPPSFLFCGASGTGKTLLTKALADFLFGDPKAMLRFDMSEYQEKHSVSRLIGSPPGYLGHEAGGQLTVL
jgi:ATP-dependent Clp protease ATP-binding subunit ClpA